MKYLIKFLRVLGASIGIFFIIFLMIVTIELFEVSKIIVLPVTAIGLFFVRDFFENHAWWKIRAWEQKNLAHGIKLKRFFKQRGDLPSDGVCKVGPFYGKVFSQPSFHAGAAALFSRAPLLTVQKRLSVDIPPVGNFRFNISGEQISHADWMRWQASSNDLGSDLIASLTWDVPEPQLRQALQAPEAIW